MAKTSRRTFLSSTVMSASALALLALAPAARAEPSQQTRMLDLTIATGNAPTNLSLSVADQSCSVAESAQGEERARVKVCHEGGEAKSPIYAFEVAYENGRSGRQHFEVRARVSPGVRVMIGKHERRGVETNVSVTLAPPSPR